MNPLRSALLHNTHHDPFQYLGVHENPHDRNTVIFRALQPSAKEISLLTGNLCVDMKKIDPGGIFTCVIPKKDLQYPLLEPYDYRYAVSFHSGVTREINDPYRFMPLLGELDRYLFNAGTNYSLYNQLGSHLEMHQKLEGTVFRVWAPAASNVAVIGHFNGWDKRVHQMRSLDKSGIWELFIPGLPEDELYRFVITTQGGDSFEKSDPFQFFGEIRPENASVIRNLNRYQWGDEAWRQSRAKEAPYAKPVSIYEVHPGSWRRDPDQPERFLTFKELADQLIPYVKELGFTHIELLPVMEHPLDESWGYQVTGSFSVSSRYGVPDDFMYFVDQCHQNNLGVILDWVPAHFPKDPHSLARFDGTALYEHEDPRKGAHPDWGTLIFNYGRNEVSNYLIASALFWLDKYHIDGLRVDAVASMLYLDYSRGHGEWLPNCYGGRENLEAIEFIRHLNSILYEKYPHCLMIAEESTSFYGVSKPTNQGGLGFGFKWNMGWMNDILNYFSKDALFRKYHHNSLTFSLMYAFSENFILPLSHDEVVHGKRSLLEKMPGDDWQKFANLRLLYLAMWLHPGKKLLFMGGEFGQRAEWSCKQSLDWHLLEHHSHRSLLEYVAELNEFYTSTPALWELDHEGAGFDWLDIEDRDNSIISFVRWSSYHRSHVVCLLNFTPQTLPTYKIGLPENRRYALAFCSDLKRFGGEEAIDVTQVYTPSEEPFARAAVHTTISVPPLAGVVLKPL